MKTKVFRVLVPLLFLGSTAAADTSAVCQGNGVIAEDSEFVTGLGTSASCSLTVVNAVVGTIGQVSGSTDTVTGTMRASGEALLATDTSGNLALGDVSVDLRVFEEFTVNTLPTGGILTLTSNLTGSLFKEPGGRTEYSYDISIRSLNGPFASGSDSTSGILFAGTDPQDILAVDDFLSASASVTDLADILPSQRFGITIDFSARAVAGTGISGFDFGSTALFNLTASDGIFIEFDNPAVLSNPALGQVPLPAGIWLFLSGLIGLLGAARSKALTSRLV